MAKPTSKRISDIKNVTKSDARGYHSTIRQEKKNRTRIRLLSAAKDLYQTPGGQPLTLQAVCQRAKTGLRTLFRHFPTRAALLAAMNEPKVVASNVQMNSIDDLPALVVDLIEQLDRIGNELHLRLSPDTSAAIDRLLRSLFDSNRERIASVLALLLDPMNLQELLRECGSTSRAVETITWTIERLTGRALSKTTPVAVAEDEPFID